MTGTGIEHQNSEILGAVFQVGKLDTKSTAWEFERFLVTRIHDRQAVLKSMGEGGEKLSVATVSLVSGSNRKGTMRFLPVEIEQITGRRLIQ